jgi:predicted amidohydrolase YtcJ
MEAVVLLSEATRAERRHRMAKTLFTNVNVLDGSGAAPYRGEVLVTGNRIAEVGRNGAILPHDNVRIIDGGGAPMHDGQAVRR